MAATGFEMMKGFESYQEDADLPFYEPGENGVTKAQKVKIAFSSKYDFENEWESDLPISPKFISFYKSLSSVIWSALNALVSKTNTLSAISKFGLNTLIS